MLVFLAIRLAHAQCPSRSRRRRLLALAGHRPASAGNRQRRLPLGRRPPSVGSQWLPLGRRPPSAAGLLLAARRGWALVLQLHWVAPPACLVARVRRLPALLRLQPCLLGAGSVHTRAVGVREGLGQQLLPRLPSAPPPPPPVASVVASVVRLPPVALVLLPLVALALLPLVASVPVPLPLVASVPVRRPLAVSAVRLRLVASVRW